jgi:hypothetical protein
LWTEREIFEWIEAQPTENKNTRRGWAKKNTEAREIEAA